MSGKLSYCKNRQKSSPGHFPSPSFRGEFFRDEPLARHTWYRIGGPADVLACPMDADDLSELLRCCKKWDIPTFILGEGANLLVHDEGFRGVVIHLKHLTRISIKDTLVTADAGARLEDVVLACERQGLGGIEYLAGIPGTIGGALMMNAGTSRGEIGDRVQSVFLFTPEFDPLVLNKDRIQFQYRFVPQLQDKILLGCTLELFHEEEAVLKRRRLEQLSARAATQPLNFPSCGSVFKRPPGFYVGKMVQDLGLKGLRRGDAMISEKHGGFILNVGNATSADVLYLIEKISTEVYRHFQVKLEPEVRFVGFRHDR